MKIHDHQVITIDVIDGERTEDRTPRRVVTLSRDDIPELPDVFEWRGKKFVPSTVTIIYRVSRDSETMIFDDLSMHGPMILKTGKVGTRIEHSQHFMLADGLSEERLERVGEYLVPAFLAPYVHRFDPLTGDYPFAAE